MEGEGRDHDVRALSRLDSKRGVLGRRLPQPPGRTCSRSSAAMRLRHHPDQQPPIEDFGDVVGDNFAAGYLPPRPPRGCPRAGSHGVITLRCRRMLCRRTVSKLINWRSVLPVDGLAPGFGRPSGTSGRQLRPTARVFIGSLATPAEEKREWLDGGRRLIAQLDKVAPWWRSRGPLP